MMKSFKIRACQNPGCGLRYPIVVGQTSGKRCPACLGETLVVLEQALGDEEAAGLPSRRPGGPSLLLDNIRSAWNVGSILRTADGFGFKHAYLCGISASPGSAEVRKTSLGAEESVSWSLHPDGLILVEDLKHKGFHVLALETAAEAQDFGDWSAPEGVESSRIVLVVGSEVTGIDPGILRAADELVRLPMYGQKRSFNVAVAFGIAAYQLRLRLNDQNAG